MDLPKADRYFLEIQGANSSATLYVNGKKLANHDGGYSTWRVDITDALEDKNLFVFEVDNSQNDRVYPQNADFTFYGGILTQFHLSGIVVGASNASLENPHFVLKLYICLIIYILPSL